ncbi:MAG: cyclic nucleotide-binding domain-containing protein [Nitrospina sp.]|nr:cyclic nucleotide-binding domain-containing protein [Nitrospina sp.]MBT3510720.1 cyclic nucleotide-binding domain-containing protein [Nitrospina sp.]MBT3875989.1 cyclic nucleotide-binding domain-containing protein [Nitrospina sp.]MBT4048968.1 cyclic nucleotide-binding domain-containing protein [Nitrospina sp.]MBT4557646.1 cyclic nucleotide-binding domain-containing protein [Nitrospina sp.]
MSFSKFIQDDDLWYLLYACENISLKAGQVLFAEKSFKESMFVVLDGKLEVYKQNKHIAFQEMGGFFGEMSLLESKPRSASVRAVTDSVLLEIDKDTFFSYIGSNTKAIWDILKTLSQRNRSDLDVIDSGYGELKRSEEKHRGIVESISDIIIQVDPEGVICFANRSVSSLGYEVDNLIGKRFSEIFDGKLGDIRKHHILTRRVGLRATINMEVSLKVNPLSSLHGLIWYLPFLVNTSGMWNVPQEIVLKKGATKEFLGSLLIARTDKKGLIV